MRTHNIFNNFQRLHRHDLTIHWHDITSNDRKPENRGQKCLCSDKVKCFLWAVGKVYIYILHLVSIWASFQIIQNILWSKQNFKNSLLFGKTLSYKKSKTRLSVCLCTCSALDQHKPTFLVFLFFLMILKVYVLYMYRQFTNHFHFYTNFAQGSNKWILTFRSNTTCLFLVKICWSIVLSGRCLL